MSITVDDFLLFCDRTIAGHLRVVDRLGDDRLNDAPDLTGANTPFQLVTHALWATEWWCSHIICGEASTRVRDDEFAAAGSLADLHARAEHLRSTLHRLRPQLAAATTLADDAPTTEIPLGRGWTPGAAMLHAYEELAQHLGHLEITADLLSAR